MKASNQDNVVSLDAYRADKYVPLEESVLWFEWSGYTWQIDGNTVTYWIEDE